MKISNIQRRIGGGAQELAALVEWEDNKRASQEIHFRVINDEVPIRADNYHPFLVGALAPALRHGERRIKIDGAICPVLKENLRTLAAYLTEWYWYDYGIRRGDRRSITLEADDAESVSTVPSKTGCFFSGGVDSFCMIRQNRLLFAKTHPFSIRDAIFVHGFDMGGRPELGSEIDSFKFMTDEFKPVLDEAELNLLPVYTNIASLEPTYGAWSTDFMGPAMGAVAHLFSGYLSDVCIASSGDASHWRVKYSSHPLTDPHLGSQALRVHHLDTRFRRIDKVEIVAEWPEAMRVLRVCMFGQAGKLNCQSCEKCVRTALELLSVGKGMEARSLLGGELTPGLVRKSLVPKRDNVDFYTTIAAALEKRGHNEIAHAVKSVLRRRYAHTVDFRETVRWADKSLFGGWLKQAYRERANR